MLYKQICYSIYRMIHWIGLIYQHLLLYRFTTYSMNVSPNQRIHIYNHKNGDENILTTHLCTKDDLKYCECLYSVYSFIIYAYCSFPSSMIKTLWTTRSRSWPVCTVKNFWPLEAEEKKQQPLHDSKVDVIPFSRVDVFFSSLLYSFVLYLAFIPCFYDNLFKICWTLAFLFKAIWKLVGKVSQNGIYNTLKLYHNFSEGYQSSEYKR